MRDPILAVHHSTIQLSVRFIGDSRSFFSTIPADDESSGEGDINRAGFVTAIILFPLAATTFHYGTDTETKSKLRKLEKYLKKNLANAYLNFLLSVVGVFEIVRSVYS